MRKAAVAIFGLALILFVINKISASNRILVIDEVDKAHEWEFEHKSILSPVNVRLSIAGEIDGDAIIIVSEKRLLIKNLIESEICTGSSDMHYAFIKKGKVNIPKNLFDYYQNAPGYIYYIPCQAKKGDLKITWNM